MEMALGTTTSPLLTPAESGPIGLATLKCLLEEGFAAEAFEYRDDVGGVWTFSTDTSTTTSLKGNGSPSRQ